MKKRLQEAWTEVKSSRSKTSLGPIRTLSREDLRSSIEDLSKKKKGEVIFEVTHQILNMLCGIFCTINFFYVMQDSFTAIVFDCSVQIQDMVCRQTRTLAYNKCHKVIFSDCLSFKQWKNLYDFSIFILLFLCKLNAECSSSTSISKTQQTRHEQLNERHLTQNKVQRQQLPSNVKCCQKIKSFILIDDCVSELSLKQVKLKIFTPLT